MNAMVGDPGELTNRFNPDYLQFSSADISNPANIFVFSTNIRTPSTTVSSSIALTITNGATSRFLSQRRRKSPSPT
jgi:hypothetical protein